MAWVAVAYLATPPLPVKVAPDARPLDRCAATLVPKRARQADRTWAPAHQPPSDPWALALASGLRRGYGETIMLAPPTRRSSSASIVHKGASSRPATQT